MIKIAYISHVRDRTGYGYCAEYIMECLSAAGADVVSCWTTLSNNIQEPSEIIKRLENKDLNNVDVIITHSLPQHFTAISGVKNIGLFVYETSSFRGSNWQYSANLMDQIWTITPECVDACIQSGITKPIVEIDSPHDKNKFTKKYNPIKIPSLKNRFIFYSIGEISYRKNISAIVASYYAAFTDKDNVALIIKGFTSGKTKKETEDEFQNMINQFKQEIRRGTNIGFPPILLISDWLTDDQIMGLHTLGHCFVTASRGEAENIPLFEAAAMGKRCIAPRWNGPKKMLRDTCHYLIPTTSKFVFGMSNSLPNLYFSDESWEEPNLIELKKAMRQSFINEKNNIAIDIETAKRLRNRFSYETIGPKLMEILQS